MTWIIPKNARAPDTTTRAPYDDARDRTRGKDETRDLPRVRTRAVDVRALSAHRSDGRGAQRGVPNIVRAVRRPRWRARRTSTRSTASNTIFSERCTYPRARSTASH